MLFLILCLQVGTTSLQALFPDYLLLPWGQMSFFMRQLSNPIFTRNRASWGIWDTKGPFPFPLGAPVILLQRLLEWTFFSFSSIHILTILSVHLVQVFCSVPSALGRSPWTLSNTMWGVTVHWSRNSVKPLCCTPRCGTLKQTKDETISQFINTYKVGL